MSNNSGVDAIVINNLERAVSTDQNRAAQFTNRALMECFRQLAVTRTYVSGFETSTTGINRGGDDQGDTVTPATPLRATVLGGLDFLVEQQTLTVLPGVFVALNPETPADPDDSPAVYCESLSGVPLAFVANAGNARWDLIEVRPVFGVKATASRDIYNPATQTFASQLVDKVTGNALEFRIRSGVAASPSAGPPAFELGWLPIGVIFHPGATASLDDCQVFDVRPLFSERIQGTTSGLGLDLVSEASMTLDSTNDGNEFVGWAAYNSPVEQSPVSGSAWTAGYRSPFQRLVFGGPSETVSPDFAPAAFGDQIEFGAAGLSLVSNQWYGIAVVFPFGLPRWVRYSRIAAPLSRRSPLGGHGITVVTSPDFGASFVPLPNYYNTSGLYPAVGLMVMKALPVGIGPGFVPMRKERDGWHRFPQAVGGDNRLAIGAVQSATEVDFVFSRGAGNLVPLGAVSGLGLMVRTDYSSVPSDGRDVFQFEEAAGTAPLTPQIRLYRPATVARVERSFDLPSPDPQTILNGNITVLMVTADTADLPTVQAELHGLRLTEVI